MAAYTEPRRERRAGMSETQQLALVHDDLDYNDRKWDRHEQKMATLIQLGWMSFASFTASAILLALNLALK